LLRSELFSIEQLKRHAVTLASQHRVDSRPGPDRLLPRLADNERVLLAAYDVVTAAATPGKGSCRQSPGCSTISTSSSNMLACIFLLFTKIEHNNNLKSLAIAYCIFLFNYQLTMDAFEQ
jgi:hypothetical protein